MELWRLRTSTVPHPFTITMQVTTLSLEPQIPFTTSWLSERRRGEEMWEDPRPDPPSSPGGAHYPRVIVRLSDRLLRIRGYLADAVDSPYYAVTTATWPTLIWKRGFCNPERCGKMCLLMSNKSLLHLKSISHVVRKTVVDNNPSLLCRVCLTHITSQPPHKM